MLNNLFAGIFDAAGMAVISVPDFLICIVVSLAIGAFITWVYTYKSRYTTSFAVTLAMLPEIVCIVIMMVNGNVGVGVAVAGCTGTKSSTGNVVSSETETNAEETSAQSEAGTFSSADMFTERDLAGTYEESGAVYVTLSDDGITGETDGVAINGQTVTITAEGTYIFSRTLSEGQIVVDADNEKVQIVFDNVDITCASSVAVYVKSAEKVFVTLTEGSQNTLRNTDEYVAVDDNNIDAVIFAKSDLTLNGTGSLTIVSAEGHGIVSKDDLKITGGTYDITTAGHALSGAGCKTLPDR